MPKTTAPFGAALDPALIAAESSSTTGADRRRGGPSAVREAAAQELRRSKRSSGNAPQSKRNVAEAHAASSTSARTKAHTSSMAQIARPPVPSSRSDLSVGDVTDPICEFDTTSDPVSTTSATPSHPLARLLAKETAEQRTKEASRLTHAREESTRRTLYGNKRRRMTRESLRSTRNLTSKRTADVSDAKSDVVVQMLPAEKGLSVAEAAAIAPATKSDEQPSSQHTHISLNSSDGVYHTQFSFYRFEDGDDTQHEGQREEGAGSSVPFEEPVALPPEVVVTSDSLPAPHEHTQTSSTQGVVATQRGYDADLSASCSSLGQSLDVRAVRYEAAPNSSSRTSPPQRSATLQQLLAQHHRGDDGVHVYQPILYARDDSSPTPVVTDDGHSLAQHRRIAALCDRSVEKAADVRHVHPTIWTGAVAISQYFGPFSLDAFQFRQSPPARHAVQRWAEWMDSQSSDGVTVAASTAATTPGEALYTYEGTFASIPPFSTT